MIPILPTPDLTQSLLHLNPEEQGNPVAVIAELCDEYAPGEMRNPFNSMQRTALLDNQCYHPSERDAQIFFGGLVLKALEACYLVCLDHKMEKAAGG